jgi:hypothetical protein
MEIVNTLLGTTILRHSYMIDDSKSWKEQLFIWTTKPVEQETVITPSQGIFCVFKEIHNDTR